MGRPGQAMGVTRALLCCRPFVGSCRWLIAWLPSHPGFGRGWKRPQACPLPQSPAQDVITCVLQAALLGALCRLLSAEEGSRGTLAAAW